MENKLKVDFKFLENVITHYNSEQEPVYGDIIQIVVNDQMFMEIFNVSLIDKDRLYERERARLFGVAIGSIGKEIERQAEHGRPAKRVENGLTKICF